MKGDDVTDSILQDESGLLSAWASRCREMVLLLLAALLDPPRAGSGGSAEGPQGAADTGPERQRFRG